LKPHDEKAEGRWQHHPLPKLIEPIKLFWVTDMPLNYFWKLSTSMPKRLKEVILQKREMTRY
jgi:hypothetical protein